MDHSSSDRRTPPPKPTRELLWIVDRTFRGWICSQCEWNEPIPTLLNDPDAKTAFDRLSTSKFRSHNCADNAVRLPSFGVESFTTRIRKMVAHGYKPKDAVELFMQEVALEFRNQPKTLAQAKSEADDFLRRLRAGLI